MLKTLLISAAATAAVALSTPVMAATALNATFDGTLTTSQQNPVPGQQTFSLTGDFLTYAASANLPQIDGNDLSQYSFTVTGTSSAYDATTRTVTYSDVTGTINGYGEVVQNLAPTTLTVSFDPTFETATILGTLESAGPLHPAGFPDTIDFTPADGAQITGEYTSNGVQGGSVAGDILFASAISAAPEPGAWALMLGGVGAMGLALRNRRRQSKLARVTA